MFTSLRQIEHATEWLTQAVRVLDKARLAAVDDPTGDYREFLIRRAANHAGFHVRWKRMTSRPSCWELRDYRYSCAECRRTPYQCSHPERGDPAQI